MNTALPAVSGPPKPGAVTQRDRGHLAQPPDDVRAAMAARGGRRLGGRPGANGPSYVASTADAGVALRVVVTASNADGSAIVASAPTAPVAAIAPPALRPQPAVPTRLRIALRDHARHSKGTLAATVVSVRAGREVRTTSAKVAVTAGTWRLRLCAGPKNGRLRCTLSKRVRTRTRTVRLPAAMCSCPPRRARCG